MDLEGARKDKLIGKSLDAKVEERGHFDLLHIAAQNLEDFRELINVSQLKIEPLLPVLSIEDKSPPPGVFGSKAVISKADGQKCERCWHWETDVGSNLEHPTICGRCVEAVKQSGAK